MNRYAELDFTPPAYGSGGMVTEWELDEGEGEVNGYMAGYLGAETVRPTDEIEG